MLDKPMSHQRVQWWVFRFEEIIKRSGKVEEDWQEKREHRTLSPPPPGGMLILISLLAVARLPTSYRSRCCLDCLVPWCHTGSGTTPKAEDTLTRICAKSIHALMHIDISGVPSGKWNPLPLKRGLHLNPPDTHWGVWQELHFSFKYNKCWANDLQ